MSVSREVTEHLRWLPVLGNRAWWGVGSWLMSLVRPHVETEKDDQV